VRDAEIAANPGNIVETLKGRGIRAVRPVHAAEHPRGVEAAPTHNLDRGP
jgi:hypothetical protein